MTPLPPARQVALAMRIYNGKEKESADMSAERIRRIGTPAGTVVFE
jgi:hypothetical protein